MEPIKNSEEPPKLIEYIVTCGARQTALVDYISKLDENSFLFTAGLAKEILAKNGIFPEITSQYPLNEKPDFPLSPHFPHVFVSIA